ncbi:MAG: CYTH domain-containing protein [Deltaproteobacteria bacterium]|nr:CYTH domain-containing protein [Deltaproteobacteria bacterium]
MPNEIELKLLIDPSDAARLLRHPLLKAHTRQQLPPQRLLSVYYDTLDLRLYKNKIAVRLRRVGKRWIQTVKTEGRVVNGLHERPEWEQETRPNTLDFHTLVDPQLRAFFADTTLQQSLHPVFTTTFTRARRILAWPGGDIIEFALDRGEIRAGDHIAPICEVELELKAGVAERLSVFAAALRTAIPLHPSDVSKAERGYQLVTKGPVDEADRRQFNVHG